MTLAILAAGMGSRYGGLKQLDKFTDSGEFIIDFSIFDAIKSGFDRVVFIIKRENLDLFKETVGKRVEKYIKVEYAFQDINDVPSWYEVPNGRTKPWGTAHAILSARDIIDDNFAVINADDFYGRDCYIKAASHLKYAKRGECCMVGYLLRNTLTKNGTVSRGICRSDESGMLASVTERTAIRECENDAEYLDENGNWTFLSGDSLTSMNCWGLTPDMFVLIEKKFHEFLKAPMADPMKSECYLPMVLDSIIKDGGCTVKLYDTTANWYGVTYINDKEYVRTSIRALMDNVTYPKNSLWEGMQNNI